MIFCYTHRQVPYSPIIREPSSCSRWEQILRPTPHNTHRETLYYTVSIQSLCSELWGPHRKRDGKKCKSQRGWRTPGEQGPLYHLSKALMNLWKLKQHAQGCTGLCQVLCQNSTAFTFSTFSFLDLWFFFLILSSLLFVDLHCPTMIFCLF